MQMMMNLPVSRKRSASPLDESELHSSSGGMNNNANNGNMNNSHNSNGSLSSNNSFNNGNNSNNNSNGNNQDINNMNYDQLSALHYAKRLRLAQAQAAAAAQEAVLFRPTMMDLYGLPMAGAAAMPRFLSQAANPYSNFGAMNMGMNMNMNMNPASVSPTGSNPLAWRANVGLLDMPTLPALNPNAANGGNGNGNNGMSMMNMNNMMMMNNGNNGNGNNMMNGPGHNGNSHSHHQGSQLKDLFRSNSPNKHQGEEPDGLRSDSPQETLEESSSSINSSLEQLSAFASHMPSMPVHNHKNQRSSTSNTSSNSNTHSSLVGDLFCSPTGQANAAKPSRPYRCIPIKKAHLPVPDPNGKAVHWEDRPHVPLAIDEDANWLSEFQCFLRSDILEVFVASPATADNRNASKKIADSQIGVRCRFCAHLHPTERASRSSAFPSSVRQIYQSFTMMLREHLSGQCEAMPQEIAAQFARLKGQSAQSASDSKRYWIYAAQKLGMVDTPNAGIQMSQETIDQATAASNQQLQAFGKSPELTADLQQHVDDVLVTPADQAISSEFVHAVVQEAQLVHLAASEKIGNRSCLTVGLPGMACKHCCAVSRSGLARVFPARKRNLKTKVQDLYDHLRRCTLVPTATQQKLISLYQAQQAAGGTDKKSKVYYARLWRRLGHEHDDSGVKTPPRGNSPILSAPSPGHSPNSSIAIS